MKMYIFSTLVLAMCLVNPVADSEVKTCIKQRIETTKEKVKIQYKFEDKVVKDKQEVPMLYVKGNMPVVKIEGSKKATDKINAFYEEKQKWFEGLQEEYVRRAEEDYSMKTKEQKKYWHGYELGSSYTSKRADEKVISMLQEDSDYTGGAHPNTWKYAQTFSSKTGNRLTLRDIVTDKEKAIKQINDYLLQETKKEKYKDYFFEDYEKNLKEILTEDTWYFSDEGLVIISNEYIISPHAVGILEFTIPYSELTYLKQEYMPDNK